MVNSMKNNEHIKKTTDPSVFQYYIIISYFWEGWKHNKLGDSNEYNTLNIFSIIRLFYYHVYSNHL